MKYVMGLLSTADEGVNEICYGFAIYMLMIVLMKYVIVCYLLLIKVLMQYVMSLLSTADECVDEICYECYLLLMRVLMK